MERDFLTGLGLDESAVSQILEEHERDVQRVQSELADVRGELDRRKLDSAARRAIGEKGLKFSSKAAEKAFFDRLGEKLAEGSGVPEGLDELIQSWRTEDPGAFESGRAAPRILAPAGVGGASEPAAPENVARAREMGAERAAARKAAGEALKNFL